MLAAALLMALPLASAQQARASRTEVRYLGGFQPDACRYPPEARRQGISACCLMDLDIGADGRVLKSAGECTDPVFLEPTRRCLTVQQFIPATQNGAPIQAHHRMEYEWRATGQRENLCKRLRTS